MKVTILWFCDTCGSSGEVETDMSRLEELTIEDAAIATLDAVSTVFHSHPVQPRIPSLC